MCLHNIVCKCTLKYPLGFVPEIGLRTQNQHKSSYMMFFSIKDTDMRMKGGGGDLVEDQPKRRGWD